MDEGVKILKKSIWQIVLEIVNLHIESAFRKSRIFTVFILFQTRNFLIPLLTLKGRGYFTNKRGGGGGIMAPPVISARSNGKRLIFSGY